MMYKSLRSLLSTTKHANPSTDPHVWYISSIHSTACGDSPLFSYIAQLWNLELHLRTSNITVETRCQRDGSNLLHLQVQIRFFEGHGSSSWEELVKVFSPPSSLEELTQLIETTAHSAPNRRNPIAQPGEIVLQPCYRSWHWPRSKTNCTTLLGSSRGSVSLLTLDVENRRAAERWVGGCFFCRCRWIFRKHFHLSGWVIQYMWRIDLACVAALWLKTQLQRLA